MSSRSSAESLNAKSMRSPDEAEFHMGVVVGTAFGMALAVTAIALRLAFGNTGFYAGAALTYLGIVIAIWRACAAKPRRGGKESL